jgi:hypothetical protein
MLPDFASQVAAKIIKTWSGVLPGAVACAIVLLPARHIERPHADGAHVAERLRLDRFVEARAGKPTMALAT